MPKTKVEVYDKNQLIYPFIESDHVTFSNGMKVNEMLDQSISMPTVIHEDLSFKVGVGDQDVSNAIVDSSVSEMTIKGKTYQNILPEPSTHVLTNNKEMFKVNEGLDPNVEIVDGVSKSAILSGQTLVNIVNNDNWVQGTNNDRNLFTQNISIKKGQTYTVIGKIERSDIINESEDPADVPAFRIRTGTNNSGTSLLFIQQSETVIKQTFTNNKNDTIHIRFFNQRTNYKKLMIIEGDYTQEDIPYFTGMQSVKMPVLKTTGKNLFDKNNYTEVGGSEFYSSVIGGENVPTGTGDANHKWMVLKLPIGETYSVELDKRNTYPSNWRNSVVESDVNTIIKGATYRTLVCEVSDNTKISRYTFTTTKPYVFIHVGYGSEYSQNKQELLDSMMLNVGSNVATYEPYKSNILTTPEDLELRGIGDVKDTLDCLTGELTQRIGEIVLDGSENWSEYDIHPQEGYTAFITTIETLNNLYVGHGMCFISGDFPTGSWADYLNNTISELVWNHDPNKIGIRVRNEIATDVNGIKAFLSANNIKINYKLATPVVKTVNLSTSGNWEKIVLNGSENWTQSTVNNNYFMETSVIKSNYNTGTENLVFSGDHHLSVAKIYTSNTNTGLCIEKGGGLRIRTQQVLRGQSIEDFKTYLSQNPVMVYYQTKNHQDSTQVRQPIFFKDGHIQLSSGADNSLISTLDYQAKTSNSYVMDLMKTNTRYTMKAKSASGTFTIDGTSYGAGTNGTFTTPTSMTNKLLVMSNKTNTEVMILEGDVTSKTIPYFKGIKSAFEDEDKIEVLSTGRNLCPPQPEVEGHYVKYQDGTYTQHGSYNVSKPIRVIEGHRYRLINTNKNHAYYDKNMNYVTTPLFSGSDADFYSIAPKNAVYLRVSMMKGQEAVVNTDGAKGEYREPNSTKIPLLSPLRSLPNGVCDEIILDRENNKAKIIQRAGEVVLDGKEDWTTNSNLDSTETKFFYLPNSRIPNTWGRILPAWRRITNNRFVSTTERQFAVNQKIEWISGGDNTNGMIQILIKKERLSTPDVSGFKQWLSQNPVMVYYELETPVITEVDLEGFPYIYKDGHIFLNSEIVPTTEIVYSVNQCQQISASNEDIIRHEKEFTYLQKLIAQYVQVDYESALLSLKV